jgi:hypothetical protein
MAANHPRGRRSAAIATALAAVILTAGLVTGCDSTNGSLNCFKNAGTIADSLRAIHEAGLDASNDPTRTDKSIDTINKNLDKISDRTDDGKVKKAVDKLSKAIKDYNKAVLNGDTNPDSGRIREAADELTDVCVP